MIKLGALGDFVLAFGPFAAIRARHPAAEISLLTTAPFADLAARSPWFDRVIVDERPGWWNLAGVARLARRLRGFGFVYDLQTSGRSSRYHVLAGRPGWSGIARGASHSHDDPARDGLHTLERQRGQLERAGLTVFPAPELDWLRGEPALVAPAEMALLVPGAAPHRPGKRWPAARFGELAGLLAARGLSPVVIGAAEDAALAGVIRAACPQVVDWTGRTTIVDVAGIAARAVVAVGNDTGPMHLAAMMGCPSVVLFSHESDPVLTAPRGMRAEAVRVIRAPVLAGLPADVVMGVAAEMLEASGARVASGDRVATGAGDGHRFAP